MATNDILTVTHAPPEVRLSTQDKLEAFRATIKEWRNDDTRARQLDDLNAHPDFHWEEIDWVCTGSEYRVTPGLTARAPELIPLIHDLIGDWIQNTIQTE